MATSANQQGVVGADSGAIWMWTEACVILRGYSPFKMTFRFVDLLRRHLFLSFYNDSPLFSTFFLISPAWCYLVAQLVGKRKVKYATVSLDLWVPQFLDRVWYMPQPLSL